MMIGNHTQTFFVTFYTIPLQPMLTIISGTNRAGSNSLKLARLYENEANKLGVECQLLSLEQEDMSKRTEEFKINEAKFLVAADKFIIIMPEYNGSYPGILKLMIDSSDIAPCWNYKKVLLTGVSTGRAGNLRGMEHLTGSLLHMKMNIHHNRLPVSNIHQMFDGSGEPNEVLKSLVRLHVGEFVNW